MRKTLLLLIICLAWIVTPAWAQDYGVGETINVPKVQPGSIVIDGEIEVDVWDTGAPIDLLENVNWWAEGFPQDIEDASAQILFSDDTLYIHVFIDDNELFMNADAPWVSDQILIGIDPVHEAGVTDQLVDQDDWAGWPENAPDLGPYAFKIYMTAEGGEVTLNFDAEAAAPFVNAAVYTNEEEQSWGIEAAIYVPTVEEGAEIGFNIGGVQANAAACEADATEGECAYGYFSRWSTENPGSDIHSRTDSYGTLHMGFGGEGYGNGQIVEVPFADPAEMVMDGVADEAAWEDAQEANIVASWNFYGEQDPAIEEPDFLETTTKLLWSQDTLYVYTALRGDPELFSCCGEGDWWSSDMILVGLDNSAAGDSLFGPGFDGGIGNAPEGPHTYFITPPAGFTIGWNLEIIPEEMGWVNGTIFSGEDPEFGDFMWGIEAAFYMPNIELGAQVGFDIGGAQASQFQLDEAGYGDYAYFGWNTTGDPGAINRDASQWVLLEMVEELTTGIEVRPGGELPGDFVLEQNYPNPFNPSTIIEFGVPQTSRVTLSVYNMLGQQVATLIDSMQQTGTYRVQWQAENLPSGVYLYQLQVDGAVVAAKKMMLMK